MKTVTWVTWFCAVLMVGGIGCLGSDLVISEIAWAGTAANSADEWIELQNTGDTPIDLTGWHLALGDRLILLGEAGEDTLEVRTTTLAPGQLLILERSDDSTISDITADVLYQGTLTNGGMLIELRDPAGAVIDSVIPEEEVGWLAGSASDGEPAYCTMERTANGEWVTNNGIIVNGLDADGNPLNGTPGQMNSAAVLAQWAPAVDLTFPTEAGAILAGTELVLWVASDPNTTDASLSMAVLLSANEGADWVVLIEGLTNAGSYSWDTSAHPAGDKYQLQVRATDVEGYVGQDVSPVFTLVNEES